MRVHSRLFYSFIFKAVILGVSVFAVFLLLLNLSSITFVYFTNLSNLVVALFYVLAVVYSFLVFKNKKVFSVLVYTRIKAMVTISITITFLVYFLLLSDSSVLGFFTIKNWLLHFVVPILVILDWYLFDEHYLLKWYEPILWVIIPVTYFLFASIRGQIVGISNALQYPYFFLNIYKYGFWKVVLVVALLLMGFLAISYLFYFTSGCYKTSKTKADRL